MQTGNNCPGPHDPAFRADEGQESLVLEILTVQEFAERMKMSRSQVYIWIEAGFLQPGRHFIRRGRTIRFPWNTALLEKLMEDSDPGSASTESDQPSTTRSQKLARSKSRGINLEY